MAGFWALALTVAAIASLLAGCANDSTSTTTSTSKPEITSVKILLNNAAIPAEGVTANPGEKLTFKAQVEVKGDIETTVTWNVKGNQSKNTTITSTTVGGRLNIAPDETAGAVLTVTASAASSSSKTKTGTIKVTIAAGNSIDPDTPQVTAIAVTAAGDAATVQAGATLQFSAEVEVLNGASEEVDWSISSTGHRNGTAIDPASGLLTVATAETAGRKLTIRATSKAEGFETVFGEQEVTVSAIPPPPPSVTSITVIAANAAWQGYELQFIADVKVVSNANKAVTWSISSAGHNNGTTLNADGRLTIAADETVGQKLTIKAASKAEGFETIFGEKEVTVAAEPAYFSNDFNTTPCSFYDKFDGTALDMTKWTFQDGNGQSPINYSQNGWGNNEAQSYKGATNAIVKDGILSLVAEKKSNDGKSYTSAKLVTANSREPGQPNHTFSQTYGRFEAKIRLTKAEPGAWPAWWMMPVDSAYGGWPRSGEIDIMEMKGRLPYNSSSTLHWRPNWAGITNWQNQYRGGDVTFPVGSAITDWHVYGVRWEQEAMIFLIDGIEHTRINRNTWNTPFYTQANDFGTYAPFDRNFHLILNLAINGDFDSGRVRDSELPIALEIDWVRCYTLANDPWTITPSVGSGYSTRGFNN